jgi:hypothetical protein
VNLQAGVFEVGDFLIQKANQRSHQPAFSLPFFSEEQDVMPCEKREADFRKNGAVVSNNTGEKRLVCFDCFEEVRSDFVFHTAGSPTGIAKLLKSAWSICHGMILPLAC